MKFFKLMVFVVGLSVFVTPCAFSDDQGFGEDDPLTGLGEGTFMSEGGDLTMEDDLGGGQYSAEDGSMTELDDAGGGEETSLDGSPVVMED